MIRENIYMSHNGYWDTWFRIPNSDIKIMMTEFWTQVSVNYADLELPT